MALLAQFIGPGGTLGVSSAVWSCRLGCVNHRLVVTPCSAPASLGLLPTDGCFTSAQHPAGWVPDGVWCQGDAVHCCYALKGFIRIWMTYIVYYIAKIGYMAISPRGSPCSWVGDAFIILRTPDPGGPSTASCHPSFTHLILLFVTMAAGTDPSQDGNGAMSRNIFSWTDLGDGDIPLEDSDPLVMPTGHSALRGAWSSENPPFLPQHFPVTPRLGTSCCDYFGGGKWRLVLAYEGVRAGGWMKQPSPIYNPFPSPCSGPDLILELSGFSRGDGFMALNN